MKNEKDKKKIIAIGGTQEHASWRTDGIAPTLAVYNGAQGLVGEYDPKCNQIGQLYDDESNPQSGRVYSKDGISPTLDAMGGGNRQPKIAVSCASRKRGENHNLEHREDDVANALTGINTDSMVDNGLRIRKLTPRECFRLQGFPDEYFDRAASVCSDTQLYKQAGNSVTVNVIYEIAKRLKI